MPLRPFYRDQDWLLPPRLGDLIPDDHPARFVAAVVDGLDRAFWAKLGIDLDGEELGAPAYHPRVLLSVWLYGFFSNVRSARKLEAACRDQLPCLWLTGCQTPDHNTLWRFYRDHREEMRELFKRTVKTAVRLGLVDLVLQAVDGSKIAGNAARDRTYDEAGLKRLLERTELAIRELEDQNSTRQEPSSPRLPDKLAKAGRLREQVVEALGQVMGEEGPERINLTDEDAGLMKSRGKMLVGYNAQAMVSPLKPEVAGRTGLFVTAAQVVTDPDDHAQLVPMVEAAQENTGEGNGTTLGDGGYHSGPNLAECEKRGIEVLMPEAGEKKLDNPYHKDHFGRDEETNSYICPQGQRLTFRGVKERQDRPEMRVYRGSVKACRACPAFGQCTKDKQQGRALEVGPYEVELRRHRNLMATEEAKATYKKRQELVEPVFGILKELHGIRRFLLRGLLNVDPEWVLVATAFNLRTLWRIWKGWSAERRKLLTGAIG